MWKINRIFLLLKKVKCPGGEWKDAPLIPNSLVTSTLTILFLEKLKISKVLFSKNIILWMKIENIFKYSGVLYFQHGIFQNILCKIAKNHHKIKSLFANGSHLEPKWYLWSFVSNSDINSRLLLGRYQLEFKNWAKVHPNSFQKKI